MQDAAHWDRLWELFHSALEQPEETRVSFVQSESGTDAALCNRVLELLDSHSAATGFMEVLPESMLADLEQEVLAPDIQPGDRVGPYTIEELIGEGGMGAVYRAHQEEPVRRTVALKVIQMGMATRDVLARFEAERQTLALMSHSNIAQVYDAGRRIAASRISSWSSSMECPSPSTVIAIA